MITRMINSIKCTFFEWYCKVNVTLIEAIKYLNELKKTRDTQNCLVCNLQCISGTDMFKYGKAKLISGEKPTASDQTREQ